MLLSRHSFIVLRLKENQLKMHEEKSLHFPVLLFQGRRG